MSDTKGKAASAKGQQEMNVKLAGKLKKAQWDEVTEKLRALGKTYNVQVTVKAPKK